MASGSLCERSIRSERASEKKEEGKGKRGSGKGEEKRIWESKIRRVFCIN
jgi:hypothetical protein